MQVQSQETNNQALAQPKQTCSNKFCPNKYYMQIKKGVGELCTICTDRYNKNFYCVYCHQVFFDETDDGKNWIQCDECRGWVHQQCADVSIAKNGQGSILNYKCIKCKKVENKEGGIMPRRGAVARTQPKVTKKVESGTFFNIGFQWALKPQEITQDMKKLQSLLK